MKHKFFYKFQQLKRYVKQLNKLVKTGRFRTLSIKKRKQIINRIERLQSQLALTSGKKQVKRLLIAASFVLGLALTPVAAQSFQFKPAQSNAFGLSGGYNFSFVTSGDIDGDGDLDVLYNEYYGDFQYFENIGTSTAPAFAAPVTNPFGLTRDSIYITSFPEFADIDGDGDYDIISGTVYNGNILYYENKGTATAPSFGAPEYGVFGLTTTSYYYANPTAKDLDGDGDLDILYTEYYGAVSYQQNIGTATAPAFAAPTSNPFGIVPNPNIDVSFPRLVDLDNDGDYDFIYGSDLYGSIFHENIGTPTSPSFGPPQSNAFGLDVSGYAQSLTFADMDKDGDLDAIIGYYNYSNSILYQENNQAPQSKDTSVMTIKNVDYTFNGGEFDFMDTDDMALVSLNIVSLPAKGSLTLSGNPVAAGDNILAADLTNLMFSPEADSLGTAYASFDFQVMDDIMTSADTNTLTINVDAPVGVAKLVDGAKLILAPNPVTDYLRIEITGIEPQKSANLSVLNISGQLVYSEMVEPSELSNKTISTSDLANGIYFIILETEEGVIRERFIKK